jgi:hypothetical protein
MTAIASLLCWPTWTNWKRSGRNGAARRLAHLVQLACQLTGALLREHPTSRPKD